MKKVLIPVLMCVCFWGYSQSAYGSPYQYRDPAKVDLNPTINATATLQQRYNNNVNRIQGSISRIYSQLNDLNKSSEEKNRLSYMFTEKCLKRMPDISYSSDNQTDQLISYLYNCVNNEIKNN